MVGVPPAGPSTVTVRACGSTETIFALICLVLAMITPGIAPFGATATRSRPLASGGALDLLTATATASSSVAFTSSPTLIWSKLRTLLAEFIGVSYAVRVDQRDRALGRVNGCDFCSFSDCAHFDGAFCVGLGRRRWRQGLQRIRRPPASVPGSSPLVSFLFSCFVRLLFSSLIQPRSCGVCGEMPIGL